MIKNLVRAFFATSFLGKDRRKAMCVRVCVCSVIHIHVCMCIAENAPRTHKNKNSKLL